jgi:hypothetical protein
MSRHIAVLALTLALAGIAVAAATADPTGAKNSAPVTIVCGTTTYDAVANGNGHWTPAHDLNSNRVLIPVAFGPETDVFTPVGGPPETTVTPARAKGSASPNGQPQINCSYTVGPITVPGVGTFEASGTVTGFVTPG